MPKSIHKSVDILSKNQKLKESKMYKMFLGGALGAGSFIGRPNGAKLTNTESEGYQKEAQSGQNGARGTNIYSYFE